MGFKTLTTLDADMTISLGGVNKKTGKPNPKTVTGHFLGSREVDNAKSKTGKCSIHFFQTEKGNIGVWGKTDLDRKMSQVQTGVLVRVTQDGMAHIPGKNDMYKYKVEVNEDSRIEVASLDANTTNTEVDDYSALNQGSGYNHEQPDDGSLDDDSQPLDEPEYQPAPRRATQPKAADPERARRVQDLLNSAGRKVS